MRGWIWLAEGNGILYRRNSKYKVLRWQQLDIFPEQQESQTGQSRVRQADGQGQIGRSIQATTQNLSFILPNWWWEAAVSLNRGVSLLVSCFQRLT